MYMRTHSGGRSLISGPFVSIIVPLRNSRDHVIPLLNALASQVYSADRYEIIAIDNGSSDGTYDELSMYKQSMSRPGPDLIIGVEGSISTSYAARNKGITYARGSIFVFTDADCRPQQDWLELLVSPFRDPAIGIVAGGIASGHGASIAECYSRRRRLLDQHYTLSHPYRPYGQTANLAVRRDVCCDIGGFRPFMPSGGDADFCWRAQAQGWKLSFVDAARVTHLHRTTISGLIRQFRRYGWGQKALGALYGLAPPRHSALAASRAYVSAWLDLVVTKLPGDIKRAISTGNCSSAIDRILTLLCRRAMASGWREYVVDADQLEIEPYNSDDSVGPIPRSCRATSRASGEQTEQFGSIMPTKGATSDDMTFFDQQRFGILYLSRGRGRGHAIPDMEIGQYLTSINANIDIEFASYSLGAETFRSNGYDVLDLQMPDEPDPWEALIKYCRLITHTRPNLLVSHEEGQALVVAAAFGIPTIFITDFFLDPSNYWSGTLKYANETIFLGEKGTFTEPPVVNGRVNYVGPGIRHFKGGEAERNQARRELELSNETIVVLCQPGNYDEASVPIYNVLMTAWDALPYPSKKLIWLAGRDYELLSMRLAARADITVLDADWNMQRLFAACDLVITKGNRITVFEASSLGIPSISMSSGINWPDDVAISSVPTNTALQAKQATAEQLARCIIEKIQLGRATEMCPEWSGIERAAIRIAQIAEALSRTVSAVPGGGPGSVSSSGGLT